MHRLNELVEIYPPLLNVDTVLIAQETIAGLYDGVKTSELDDLSAQICYHKNTTHPGNLLFVYHFNKF